MSKHTVRTYDKAGKLLYEANFKTAEAAYGEYKAILSNLRKTLPDGGWVRVVRFRDELPMCCDVAEGGIV